MRANKLKLNLDKMEVLLVGSNLVLGSGCIPLHGGISYTCLQFASSPGSGHALGGPHGACGQE